MVDTEFVIERIARDTDDNAFLVFRSQNRIDKTVKYVLLKLGQGGGAVSIAVPEIAQLNRPMLGPLAFSPDGSPILTAISESQIVVINFAESLKSYSIQKLDDAVESPLSAYVRDGLLQVIERKGNSLEVLTRGLAAGPVPDTAEPKSLSGALGVDQVFLGKTAVYVLGDYVTDQGIVKRISVLTEEETRYLDLGSGDPKRYVILGERTDNHIVVLIADGNSSRITGFRLVVLDIVTGDRVIEYEDDSTLRSVDAVLGRDAEVLFFSIRKKGKRYPLSCTDVKTRASMPIVLHPDGAIVFNRSASGVWASKSFALAVIYAELRDRTTHDVFEVFAFPRSWSCGQSSTK